MSRLPRAFDPEAFRADGHALIDLLVEHLGAVRRREGVVRPPIPPEEMLARWPATFEDEGGASLREIVARVVDDSTHLHHPHFIGHQVTSPLPAAALCDLVAAFLNNGMAVYEMGPAASAIEQRLVSWFAGRLDLGPLADGVLTSGGSAGNLTALLAARQAKAGFDAWRDGAHAGPPLAVLSSDQTHYSVKRAVQIMGWGEGGVVPVPTDDAFRMRADLLEGSFAAAERAGRRVIGVVGSAGSTAAGAFDPLPAIADFCERRGLWLHVDGAHGASLALSRRHRHLLEGIDRVDSVVWDAHKMMLAPALVTMVLYREGRRSYEAFSQEASYLFADSARPPWYDRGARTLECTKRILGLKLYAALAVYGPALFEEYLDSIMALTGRFAATLREAPDFELAVDPACNIVCFRYAPEGAVDLDALQDRIRRQLLAEGAFYIVQTRLRGALWLRTTLINPATTDQDLLDLLDAVRRAVV
ncbi:MAG: pyridoxal-dependent decarboxylase [Polyangiaceae bacterium]|nr:pyridoxal-dependent decarboxylase [Polyangiaceae bacterium]